MKTAVLRMSQWMTMHGPFVQFQILQSLEQNKSLAAVRQ